ncbi:MAG: NnrS family protein [Oligoflexia bacterium]|nr:NnrS family protein [Oligoflexia bacterium]
MNPYRFLFPLGVLCAILGVAPWVLFGFGWLPEYPGRMHADLMIGAFLFSFVAGFLMTALPRFTGSPTATLKQILVATALLLALLLSGLLGRTQAFNLLSLTALGALGLFATLKFRGRSYDPPEFFLFVALGLVSGILGVLLRIAQGGDSLIGRSLFYHGMILSLVIGVGGQLLPALLGWRDSTRVQLESPGAPHTKLKRLQAVQIPVFAGLFALSFALEAGLSAWSGWLARAFVVSWAALGFWKLHRRPPARGTLAFWLRAAGSFVFLGAWAPVLLPSYAIHGFHLYLVGGFGLMVLTVASRVTLAHGGFPLTLEKKSRPILAASLLIVLAALTRATAPAMPASYLHHLAYAAICWIVAWLVWGFFFIPKMIRPEATG